MTVDFTHPRTAATLRAWWLDLDRDRGERARLRRIQEPYQTAFSPVFQRLWGQLQRSDQKIWPESLARVVRLLVHVRQDDSKHSVGHQFSTTDGSAPSLSIIRARRLLEEEDRERVVVLLRDAVSVLRGKINLCELANLVYWWNPTSRRRLADDYYARIRLET